MSINVKDASGTPVLISTIDDLIALIGSVTASPTANTLLARLKAIQDNTDGIEGFVDGIEALIGTTNSSLTTLQGLVDGLEALFAAATPAGTNVIGKVDHTTTGIGHGKKTVVTAGTDLAIAASTAAKWVTVQAYRANTGYIAVGGAGVDAVPTGDGINLAAGESITLAIDNLADVFVDATVSGEGVRFTYGT